jgi:hypothetical protein
VTDLERHGLEESIRRHGIKYPVLLDRDGAVIDGHCRRAIAAELGVDCPTVTLDVTADEAEELRLSLNVDRRHLDRNTRQQLVIELRRLGRSTRQIAEQVGVSDMTVRRDLSTATHVAVERFPSFVVGGDGKQRVAHLNEFRVIHGHREPEDVHVKVTHEKASMWLLGEIDRPQEASAVNVHTMGLAHLRMVRTIRDHLRFVAGISPETFIAQIPLEACREITADVVDWWLEASRLAAERLAGPEGDRIRPLPPDQRFQ